MAAALYDFNADGEDELTVKEGENLTVLERDGEEWWKCRNAKGLEGVVPASYLEVRVFQLFRLPHVNIVSLSLIPKHLKRMVGLKMMKQKQGERRKRKPRGGETLNAYNFLNRKKTVGVQRRL